MKQSKTSALAALCIGTLALSACSGAPASADGEELTIRLGHSISPENPLHAGAEEFKSTVEEESDGRISVQLFPSSQLGSETDMIEQTSSGSLDVVLASPAVMSNVYPDAAIPAMPFALNGTNETERYESLVAAADSPVMREVTDEMAQEAGLRAVDWTWWYGDRHITTSSEKIETVDDLTGLKLRTPDAKIHFLALEALGAATAPIAFPELYLALQTGTVDGQENPLSLVESQKFYEVQDYVTLTGHMSQAQAFLFSEQTWSGLSEEDQELISEAARDAGVHQSELALEANSEALERLESEHGMQVTELDVEELRNATQDAAENWAAENEGFSLERYQAFREAQG